MYNYNICNCNISFNPVIIDQDVKFIIDLEVELGNGDPRCQHNFNTAISFVLEKSVKLFFFASVTCCAPENFICSCIRYAK